MRRQYKQTKPRRMLRGRKCYYCTNKAVPSYRDVDVVAKFVSERGKIISRLKTGVCNKHQRALSKAIKRGRFMALIPNIVRPSA